DSEILIEAALEIVDSWHSYKDEIRIIDIGTGSGCLLLTLLAERPWASGVGIDIADGALEVAHENARRLGVTERLGLVRADVMEGIEGPFDLLISNPPYIATDELPNLDATVRNHDPVRALDGGADGYEFYRRIGRDVYRVVPDGWMLFEVGAGMARQACHEIDAFADEKDVQDWRVWLDLNGHERCVARKTLNRPRR
ncbi:MAG: methyltransferase domain-containing protein, partial [Alphaproteobacteria bacterium]|nr:methyltransferase domain-containing protein [Alphaproteobacteria bacterium]